jgi:protein TonB
MDQEGPEGVKRFAVPVVIIVLMAVAAWFIYKSLGGTSHEPKRQTVKIAVLPDTPPPPPPPPPKEKPPEPKEQENKPQPQEQQKPKEVQQEPQQLKMDGPAGDGPSAFAAGAVNSEYKGGEVGTGTGDGGGANKMQFALFNSQLQRHVQSHLAKNSKAKLADYRVNVQVWVSPAGDLRVELLSSTGDEKSDEALRLALTQLPPMSAAPTTLPQPIRLRITNRMTG